MYTQHTCMKSKTIMKNGFVLQVKRAQTTEKKILGNKSLNYCEYKVRFGLTWYRIAY